MLEVIEADFARLEVDTKVAEALTRPRRAPHSSDDTIDENEIDTLNKEIDELAKTMKRLLCVGHLCEGLLGDGEGRGGGDRDPQQ